MTIKRIASTDPAAGAQHSYTLTKAVKLTSVRMRLVTSATVATRTLILTLTDEADNAILEIVASATQAASLTYDYQFAAEVVASTSALTGRSLVNTLLPDDLFLEAGYKVKSALQNGQAGDDFGVMTLFGDESF